MGLVSDPSYFLDDSVVALRQPEVPNADFVGGCNLAAGNSCGVGINENVPNLVGTAQQFTPADQFVNPRTPQISQNIGGEGYADPANYPSSGGQSFTLPDDALRFGTPSNNGDGTVTPTGNCHLVDLITGWQPV